MSKTLEMARATLRDSSIFTYGPGIVDDLYAAFNRLEKLEKAIERHKKTLLDDNNVWPTPADDDLWDALKED